MFGLCLLGSGCSTDSDSAPEDGTTTGGSTGDSGTPATGSSSPVSTTVDVTTETGSSSGTSSADESSSSSSTNGGVEVPGADPEDFDPDGLTGEITVVDCTLSNGEESTCYSIPIVGAPSDHDVGPFCPRNIADGADVSGIWLESGEVYDADGSFIEGLADFYDDLMWQLFDPVTGDVFVTDTQVACEAAAQPNVPEEYNNYCVECSLDYFGGGVETVVLIPVVPVARETPAEVGTAEHVGLALNGVTMDPPAPVDAILGGYTIAAFDDCGGHVNPFAGYHYHAATGCPGEVGQRDEHAARIGYALDGYGIHTMANEDGEEPADLDSCRGHEDDVRGYHYHAASPGENMFIGCFSGEIAGEADDGGGEVMSCEDAGDGMPCCGDDVCDGPETAGNCAEDCG